MEGTSGDENHETYHGALNRPSSCIIDNLESVVCYAACIRPHTPARLGGRAYADVVGERRSGLRYLRREVEVEVDERYDMTQLELEWGWDKVAASSPWTRDARILDSSSSFIDDGPGDIRPKESEAGRSWVPGRIVDTDGTGGLGDICRLDRERGLPHLGAFWSGSPPK